ncbi:MAG TPA: DUF951 domain-containing protein [Chloroflexia bacterium]|nr:DUF951 domain-containing protein [Chloroflexia bacterium]
MPEHSLNDGNQRPSTSLKPRPGADVAVGDTVRMRKPHPCGSFDWKVVRVGADIGLRCLGCDHRVNLPRSEFERRFKTYIERAAGSGQA